MSNPGKDIPFIDIHTHRLEDNAPGRFSLFNVLYPDSVPDETGNRMFTIGLHPWHAERIEFDPDHFKTVAARPDVVAIGETGLDRLQGPAMDKQAAVFSAHAETARLLNKPVIIHCVRAWDELIAAKRRLKPDKAWIIHGFRGKTETARLLTVEGFYLSFGDILLKQLETVSELFRQIPGNRIFLETDESEEGIDDIYRAAAAIRNMTLPELKGRIESNFKNVFGFDVTSGLVTKD